jgi:hypothetical protein
MEQQKCTSCKSCKPKAEFSKNGRPIKTCLGCRTKSKIQKEIQKEPQEEIHEQPNDYSKTVIYHIICQDKTITSSYIGSTTRFNQRKNSHKSKCNNEKGKHYHLKLYQAIRSNGGWDNWKIVTLEEFSCENKTQQFIREQYWIDQLNPILNCKDAVLTEERNKYNIEYWKQYAFDVAKELHEYKMKMVYAEFQPRADYARHVYELKQSFAEIHDYKIETNGYKIPV